MTSAAGRRILAAALLGTVGGGCADVASMPRRTTVFAAASLSAAFQQLAAELQRIEPGNRIDLHFAGTPQLVMQLREGAPGDVFAAADVINMEQVVATGIAAAAATVFARNRLAIVARQGNPDRIGGLADLGRTDLRVLLCGPQVPAGRYARLALERAGVAVRSVSDEPSVQAVVSKVALGEVDAGIVYATDALGAAERIEAIPLADDDGVLAAYPIVPLASGRNPAGGAAFVAFVLSPAGQEVLRRFGFTAP